VLYYIDLEFIRIQKIGFWIWSDLQTSGDIKDRVSEFGLERVAALR